MRGFLAAAYSVAAYALFTATLLCAIAFVEGVIAPKTIDSGAVGDLGQSLVIDLLLLGVFAMQHSIMARPAFKRVWTRIVPEEAERSTYVIFASLALALLLWQWRPLPQLVWSVEPPAATAITTLSWAGFALAFASTFFISHFHLFGITQGFSRLLRLTSAEQRFSTLLFYRLIRHPLYLGFIIAFWAAPRMSLGHLAFAIATTVYILLGIFLEERDLVAQFGERYRQYQKSVGMLLPKLGTRSAERDSQASAPPLGPAE
jgi:protein-S-isoprenylcysteine O-methyltransferase Ste14